MRNLKILQHTGIELDGSLPLTATTWDTTEDSLICAFGPDQSNQVIELKRFKSQSNDPPTLIATWDAPCPHPDLNTDKIVSLHYLGHNETACLVLAGGDIVLVRAQPQFGQEKIEIVGSVDAGITAAAWSPDEELLAITTNHNTLLFMTADFDNTASASFSPDDLRLSKHVSVGWGKSETQFKGKRAKALRDPTMPEKVDTGHLSELDEKQTSITWRGDGAFVAVNSIEQESRRVIRIFSREGSLDSVSEPVDGLEGALSWRPLGNLLAGVQRHNEGVNIIFFERNGLRHGQFSLRVSPGDSQTWAKVIDLQWNTDSSILAICFCDRVQLWTMGNYHYYLKQEIFNHSSFLSDRSLDLAWNPIEHYRLSVFAHSSESEVRPSTSNSFKGFDISSQGMITLVSFCFATSNNISVPPHDIGTTAVIDGRNLRITPLRRANIPPPMALYELELTSNVKDVAINSQNDCIAVLHEKSMSLLESKIDLSSEPVVKANIDLPSQDRMCATQVCFASGQKVFVLMTDTRTGANSLFDSDGTHYSLNTFRATGLYSSIGQKELYISQGSEILVLDLSVAIPREMARSNTVCRFHSPAPWVEIIKYNDLDIAFGLTANGALFANERTLARSCTSFILTSEHLIYTTSNHLLKFVHLNDVSELDVPLDQPEIDERCRTIERGAKLVAVMPSAFSLTMQMPRGNLETIYPRALVLAAVRKNIEAKDYKSAFLTCRAHRVDMNILHDHAPVQFLESVETFVAQIQKTEHIDLFLSQLRNEDVSETLYKQTHPNQSSKNTMSQINDNSHESKSGLDPNLNSKVNRICDAFVKVLSRSFSHKLKNIITANVCKDPPDIVGGLSLVATIRETGNAESIDSAVEHICFLADVNQLYDQSLGMYDLDLTILIAQQSQKDPREYLPYIQSLQKMSQLRKQYTIDDHLGRSVKALSHLFSMDAFDEVLKYTEKHELYGHALGLYQYQPGHYAEILRKYAEYLNNRNRFQDAAIAFESLSDYASACDAFRAANSWRESLTCAALIPLPASELQALAEDLAEGLVESKDFVAAAIIHKEYLSDLPTAVSYYCKGHRYAEAMRLVSLAHDPELFTSVIDPGLMESSGSMTELLADCKAQLEAQVPRLRELRKLKLQDPLAFFEGADPADIPDNISLAPTDASTAAGNSLFTRYTNRTGTGTAATGTSRQTSKNRRREERKRARGKKGSIYEEEYLVNSVGRLVQRVNDIAEDVQQLIEGLLRRGMRERAAPLQKAMTGVVAMCRDSVKEVFGDGGTDEGQDKREDIGDGNGDGHEESSSRPQGGEGVLWDSLEEGRKKKEPPVVKAFAPSSLLLAE